MRTTIGSVSLAARVESAEPSLKAEWPLRTLQSLPCGADHSRSLYRKLLSKRKRSTYLHHEQNGVQDDQGHDDVLKAGANHQFPDSILERVLVFRHVSLTGPSLDGEIDATFLVFIQMAFFQFLSAWQAEGEFG